MTIYDIAKKAGVSASSVSRVVNNKPGVNPETREKIKKLLKEYNYVANEAARGLVTKSNRMVGILISDIRSIHLTEGVWEITRILWDYGEERYAQNIARHICRSRQEQPIVTTGQLTEIIRASIPAKARAAGGHPAKRTFQAIRIEVNRELEVLQDSLEGMIDFLNDRGRICVITFHSLEDRIVKNIFRKAENPCTCPPDFPVCVCGKKPKGIVVTRKPVVPSEEEMKTNTRSKSSKLRVFERRLGN